MNRLLEIDNCHEFEYEFMNEIDILTGPEVFIIFMYRMLPENIIEDPYFFDIIFRAKYKFSAEYMWLVYEACNRSSMHRLYLLNLIKKSNLYTTNNDFQ